MESWELHFRDKSGRRSRRRMNRKVMKAGVLTLLFGSIAAGIYLAIMGVPQ